MRVNERKSALNRASNVLKRKSYNFFITHDSGRIVSVELLVREFLQGSIRPYLFLLPNTN